MIEVVLLFVGIGLFLAGVYTGIWIQRHSYTDREVPKVITTEKLIEVEKPVVVQVPVAKPNNAQLPIMGGPQARTRILDPTQEAEAKKMQDLLNTMPELSE